MRCLDCHATDTALDPTGRCYETRHCHRRQQVQRRDDPDWRQTFHIRHGHIDDPLAEHRSSHDDDDPECQYCIGIEPVPEGATE